MMVTKGESALQDFNKAAKLNPNHAYAYNNCGIVYDKLKQYDNAISDLQQNLQFDSENETAYYNRGNAYKRRGDCYEALGEVDAAQTDFDVAAELEADE